MRRFIQIITEILFFILIFAVTNQAQEISPNNNYEFLLTNWTTENGLPQNTVTSIVQTQDGYLWLGTFGGLARFDGVRFKIYTTSNTPALKNNRITALAVDKSGTLWIGTERGELLRLKNNDFELFDDGKTFNNTAIGDIFIDGSDNLWVSSSNPRFCTSEGCKKVKNFDKGVFKFRQDYKGTIWVISDSSVYKMENDKFEQVREFSDVIDFEPSQNGGFWVNTVQNLSLYLGGKRQVIHRYPKKAQASGMKIAPNGDLWFSHSEKLFSVNGNQVEEHNLRDFGEGGIIQIFFDNQNNIWLGRVGKGLVRLLNRKVQAFTFEKNVGGTLFQNLGATSIAEDDSGSVWIATGPFLFRWRDGKVEAVSEKMSDEFANGALLFDSRKILWNITSNGLKSYENNGLIFHPEISPNKAQSGNSLFEDSRKNLWYGLSGYGVFVSDRQKILANYTTDDGLIGNNVCLITETRDGAMWFGTTMGMSRLQDGKFTNFTTENGLSNDYVRDIYEDQDRTLWIGTYGGGLNRYKDGKFTAITTKEGLFDDIVSRILVDDDDNFWMLGNRGIYSVNHQILNDFANGKIKQIYCSAYTTADGMITGEGNGGYQNAGTRTRDGKLWFPMINGVVIIDPKQEKQSPPKPMIEEVFLNGKLIDAAKKVEINPGNESLEINYTGLNFRKPEQIRFRYRLAGLDENWTEAGTRRLANYPYLPSGNFRFQLSAANADGVWSDNPAELEIIVHPPFWMTWWFISLIFIVAMLIFYLIYQYRNWYFAREKAVREEFSRSLLNAQENERRRIAAEIHDNLGQHLLIINNWASYCLSKLSSKSKIRDQIIQINETAQQALDEVRQMAKTLSPYHLDKAGVSQTIRFMVNQMAESSDIGFVTEIENIDGLLSKEEELNLYRIVQEGVNNIVRHSHATQAKIQVKKKDNQLLLMIYDNGRGFYQTADNYQEFGLGINGMTERAKMMDSILVIQTEPNRGTKIILEKLIKNGKK